ncbi:2-oxo acid dehydrogenase subunit E2 [Reichenbachiella carrageenanivorans]|uniref:Dihydrolipoamide acetyltransferase component of pyruvate dehydrogenase complex n=1 Tax=Reichenbachiella carrageenanivorans TaxID=2979869 RepID=A0ABY6CY82_9BACT|nr:dihydrolipoamide acetyltransferase family protein [Reichenbachiella carrageenanivorans]UXX78330.1 2-oxo acid dehydrogenase subunit E2 [Reichenbachiella carrageenanivorans]
MALVEMIMPKMGESIMEGTILSWLKKVGDTIEQDESVLEVATDKVDTEVPSIHAGVLKEILANEGDVVEVGKAIAIIATDGAEVSAPVKPEVVEEKVEEKAEALVAEAIASHSASAAPAPVFEKSTSGKFYSPLVLNIAREEGIPMAELEALAGTGKEGRVTKKDILAYVKSRGSNGSPVQADTATIANNGSESAAPVANRPAAIAAATKFTGEDEIIVMDRMRKMIAERMLSSKQTSPHVTSFVEADVTELVKWRGKVKNGFMEREGQALTFTPIFIEAVVMAIKDYPMINVQVDGDKIIRKGSINVGMAVALPSGNLIVPVIHNADQLSLKGITIKVNDLARRSRDNKLTPDDLSGGTYTISNVGSFGNVMGTPIIVQPQVGIMALGAIVKKPSVVETPQGDLIGIRHKMFLSHSYDHRVVDGALGGMFVRRVADYLEKFDTSRTI